MSGSDMAEMLDPCTSLSHRINSGKAADEGQRGHSAACGACIFPISAHGEVNPVEAVDLFNPHRQSGSVLKTLSLFDFDPV
jgi:hypothetical protein